MRPFAQAMMQGGGQDLQSANTDEFAIGLLNETAGLLTQVAKVLDASHKELIPYLLQMVQAGKMLMNELQGGGGAEESATPSQGGASMPQASQNIPGSA